MLYPILLILLVVLLLGSVPAYPHSRGWGYGPSGILLFILVVVLILWLMGGRGGTVGAQLDVPARENVTLAAES